MTLLYYSSVTLPLELSPSTEVKRQQRNKRLNIQNRVSREFVASHNIPKWYMPAPQIAAGITLISFNAHENFFWVKDCQVRSGLLQKKKGSQWHLEFTTVKCYDSAVCGQWSLGYEVSKEYLHAAAAAYGRDSVSHYWTYAVCFGPRLS